MKAAKKSSLSLRLSEGQGNQLEALAKKYQVSETKIVEWALQALHDYAEAHGGRVMLPINFDEMWESSARTQPHGLNEKGGGYGKDKKARCAPAPLSIKTDCQPVFPDPYFRSRTFTPRLLTTSQPASRQNCLFQSLPVPSLPLIL